MAIVKYKPTSAGRRNMSTLSNDRITKSTPEKSLLAPLNKKVDATTQDALLLVIRVEALSKSIELSTSEETRTMFLLKLLESNMIQTEMQTSHYYTI